MLGVVILRWNGTFDSRWLLASMEISWKMCEWVAVYKSPREFLRLFADIHSDWMTTCITSGRFTWTHKHTRTHIVFFLLLDFRKYFNLIKYCLINDLQRYLLSDLRVYLLLWSCFFPWTSIQSEKSMDVINWVKKVALQFIWYSCSFALKQSRKFEIEFRTFLVLCIKWKINTQIYGRHKLFTQRRRKKT